MGSCILIILYFVYAPLSFYWFQNFRNTTIHRVKSRSDHRQSPPITTNHPPVTLKICDQSPSIHLWNTTWNVMTLCRNSGKLLVSVLHHDASIPVRVGPLLKKAVLKNRRLIGKRLARQFPIQCSIFRIVLLRCSYFLALAA